MSFDVIDLKLCMIDIRCGGVPRMQILSAPPPLVGAQGYQRFPLSKPAVGWNVGLHAVPVYRASTYLVSAFPAHSTYINFCFAMIIITHRG